MAIGVTGSGTGEWNDGHECCKEPLGDCKWTQDRNDWETMDNNLWYPDCKEEPWSFLEDSTPESNEMCYCPFCGKNLKQEIIEEEDDDNGL